METSRVISAVRNQAEAKMNQLKRCQPAASAKERSEPAGTRIEKLAGEIYRRRRCARRFSRCYLEIAIAKRCRLHKLIRQRFALALKIQQEDFALIISAVEATVDPVATQRFPDAVFWSNQTQEDKSIVVEEDSGEAID
ncbi:hypothetical protein F511_02091 [Dorcoceras hygrometricum]|nr:hypothetical protein F511_02091 [Dorcoceras hygrometricum]